MAEWWNGRNQDPPSHSQREERKRETRNLVAEEIKRDSEVSEQHIDGNDSDIENMPDDRDDIEDPLEFESWKVRELLRIKRCGGPGFVGLDLIHVLGAIFPLAVVTGTKRNETRLRTKRPRPSGGGISRTSSEPRRTGPPGWAVPAHVVVIKIKMCVAVIRASGKNQTKDKEQWKFLQKYYHKGAFYMVTPASSSVPQNSKLPPPLIPFLNPSHRTTRASIKATARRMFASGSITSRR